MSRHNKRKRIHFGPPIATMFAEHLATGIPMSELDPETYAQFHIPRKNRKSKGSFLKRDVRSMKRNCIRVTIFTVILASYMFLGAIMFFYVEECLQKEKKIHYTVLEESRKHLSVAIRNICLKLNASDGNGGSSSKTSQHIVNLYMEALDKAETGQNLVRNSSDLSRNGNVSVAKCIKIFTKMSEPVPTTTKTSCGFSRLEYVKWTHFVAATCFTIGYGNTVPTSDLGKILVILYASVGIPLSIAAYTYAAKFTIDAVSVLLEMVHVRLMKRKTVAKKQSKIFALTLILLLSCVCGASFMSSDQDLDNLSLIDSFYFWFCTLTTIGYGDLTFNLENYMSNQPWLTVFIAFLVLFGLGLVATVVSSFFRLLEVSQTKEKAKQSSCLSQICCRRKMYTLEPTPDDSRT